MLFIFQIACSADDVVAHQNCIDALRSLVFDWDLIGSTGGCPADCWGHRSPPRRGCSVPRSASAPRRTWYQMWYNYFATNIDMYGSTLWRKKSRWREFSTSNASLEQPSLISAHWIENELIHQVGFLVCSFIFRLLAVLMDVIAHLAA